MIRANKPPRTLCLALAAALGLGLAGCAEKQALQTMDPTVTVETVLTQTGNMTITGSYVATVSSRDSVSVIPLTSGAVEQVAVEVGQTVTAGQLLCQFDTTSAQLSLDSAQASYDSALAQAQSSLGGSLHLSQYTTQNNIDSIQDDLNDINDTLNDLNDDKSDAKKARDNARTRYENAQTDAALLAGLGSVTIQVNDANRDYLRTLTGVPAEDSAWETMTEVTVSLDSQGNWDTVAQMLADCGEDSGIPTEQQAQIAELQSQLESHGLTLADLSGEGLAALDAARQSTQTAYEATKDQVESTEETRDDTQNSLDQAKGSQSITDSEVYSDTVNSLQKSLAAAQVGIDSAQYQLSLCTVTAPISGVVEQVNVTENGVFGSGQVAFVIAGAEGKEVSFSVTESVKKQLLPGQSVTVEQDGETYTGSISEIGVSVNANTGLYDIKAVLENADALSNGSCVELHTAIRQEKNVIIVPLDALYFEEGDAYVYVVEDGYARKKPVSVGSYESESVSLETGLLPGEDLIYTWSASLKDNAPVRLAGQDTETPEAAGTEGGQ